MLDFLKSLFGGRNTPDLNQLLKDGAFLVDVRSAGEFKSGSVKGAVNIPLDKIKNQVNQCKGKSAVIVFCKSGMRSAQAKRILDQNGIPNVINGGSWNRVDQIQRNLQ